MGNDNKCNKGCGDRTVINRKGTQGDKGPTGPAGRKGDDGIQGIPGPAAFPEWTEVDLDATNAFTFTGAGIVNMQLSAVFGPCTVRYVIVGKTVFVNYFFNFRFDSFPDVNAYLGFNLDFSGFIPTNAKKRYLGACSVFRSSEEKGPHFNMISFIDEGTKFLRFTQNETLATISSSDYFCGGQLTFEID